MSTEKKMTGTEMKAAMVTLIEGPGWDWSDNAWGAPSYEYRNAMVAAVKSVEITRQAHPLDALTEVKITCGECWGSFWTDPFIGTGNGSEFSKTVSTFFYHMDRECDGEYAIRHDEDDDDCECEECAGSEIHPQPALS